MNIPKSDEWIISFHMRVPKAGFHWSTHLDDELCLVENWTNRRLDVAHLEGLQAGRDVVTKFCALGRKLRERYDLQYDDHQIRDWVLDFANRFGPLYEQRDRDETIRNWVDAATDFADVCDVRDSLKSGIFDEFTKRIRRRPDGMHYQRSNGKTWLFAPKAISWQGAPGELRVNLYEHSDRKGVHQQAWALTTYVVNHYVDNGLSLRLNPIRINKPTLEASGVLANAYIRLWLYIVHQAEIDIRNPQTCKWCSTTITGTRRRQFCNGTCRKAYHRKNVA